MRGASTVVLSGKFRRPAAAAPGIEPLDQAHGVLEPRLLHEQPLEQVDARIELRVDVVHDLVDRRALLEDLTDASDDLVKALRDRAQGEDRGDEVVDQRQHDQDARSRSERLRLRGWRVRASCILLRVVEDHVERAAVAGDPRDRLGDLVLRREEQCARRRDPSTRRPPRPQSRARSARCSWRRSASRSAGRATIGTTTTRRMASPIQSRVIAASSRRRSQPCGRSPAARRG